MIEVLVTLAVWSILRESKTVSGLLKQSSRFLDGAMGYQDDQAATLRERITANNADFIDADYRVVAEDRPDAGVRALALYQDRQYDQAIPGLSEALRAKPDDLRLAVALTESAEAAGDLNLAISTLRGAQLQHPLWTASHGKLGDLYYQKRWYEAAAESYREGLNQQPDNQEWLYRLALTLRDQGNKDGEAAHTLEQLLRINPRHLEGRCLQGAVAYSQGDWAVARQAYTEAIRVETGDAAIRYAAHVGLAGVAVHTGEAAAAAEHARKAVELFPEQPQGHLFHSYALLAQRAYGTTLEALEQMPGRGQVADTWYAYQGYALLGLNHIDEALSAFREAVKLDVRGSEGHHGLSLVYKLQGKPGLAERSFEAAMRCKRPGQQFLTFAAVEVDARAVAFGDFEVKESHYLGDETAAFHRACHRQNGETVLVKELNEYFASQPSYVEALKREIELMKGLSHPAIAAVVADGVDPLRRRYYFVMEDPGQGTLRQLLTQQGVLPAERLRRIGKQLAEALHYCHTVAVEPGRHVVHRSLRPECILMGPDDQVKIADFGRARASGTFASQGAGSGADLFGDPTYLAPEVLEGRKADPRADVYSLGCILYEMAAGSPPHAYDGKDMDDFIDRKLDEAPVSVRSLAPDLPRELADAIDSALVTDREERQPRMADLLAIF